MAEHARVRATARVVLLDPAGRVLLFGARLVDLATPPGPVLYWYTPGGEVEHGESVREEGGRGLAEGSRPVLGPAGLGGPGWRRGGRGAAAGGRTDHRGVISGASGGVPA